MVEFAMLAAPIFLLLFGIIEVGLISAATYELENATADAGRLVRTGQAQQKGLDAAALKAAICGEVFLISDCSSKLQLNVESFTEFGGIAPVIPTQSGGTLRTDFNYNPGSSGDVVLVTVYYEWPLLGLLSGAIGNLSDGNRLLQANAVFRNEPF